MKIAMYRGTRPGLAGLYSRLVRWFERGPYSHCELVFSDGVSASCSYLDGGVRFKKIDFDPENWDFIDLFTPDHDFRRNIENSARISQLEAQARFWFVIHEGKAYDFWGNVRFCLGWISPSNDKHFCSSALMAALGATDPWRYGPNILSSVIPLLNRSLK